MKTKIILLLLILLGGLYFFMRQSSDVAKEDDTKEVYLLADFGVEEGSLYPEAREKILKSGWHADVSVKGQINDFPEIKDCGEGIDYVCSVDFQKGQKTFGIMLTPPNTRVNDSDNWLVYNKI
jgi:hypothetical protein